MRWEIFIRKNFLGLLISEKVRNQKMWLKKSPWELNHTKMRNYFQRVWLVNEIIHEHPVCFSGEYFDIPGFWALFWSHSLSRPCEWSSSRKHSWICNSKRSFRSKWIILQYFIDAYVQFWPIVVVNPTNSWVEVFLFLMTAGPPKFPKQAPSFLAVAQNNLSFKSHSSCFFRPFSILNSLVRK